MMNANLIIIESDSEGSVSSSSKREMEFESHLFPYAHRDFESEIDSLIRDPKIGGVSGDSFSQETLSCGTLEALISGKSYDGEVLVEEPMLSPVLTKAQIEVAQ